ncbi:TetR/AcrR family transcriptional regulator [Paenibacillus durus]|uniref:TetR/AcrR family transcriptional regulator n=1 Tax=Paenibacillus durus TaxID=44251 RepID=UPI000A4B6E51|nr:TetR/AcrR family transcriptional regulator [Paenibacillus durus]
MTGRRERKKQVIRERILEEARKLFFTRNFSMVSMSDVADAADIGVGTIYNYFSSKTVLLLTLLREDIQPTEHGEEAVTQYQNMKPEEVALRIAEDVLVLFDRYGKPFWKEVFGAALGPEGPDLHIMESFINYNPALYAVFMQLLEERGEKSEDAKMLVESVYCIIIVHTVTHLFKEESNSSDVLSTLRRNLKFILRRVEP